MNCRFRNVALLLLVLVLATGLASAQPSVKVNSVNSNTGAVVQSTYNPANPGNGPSPRAPRAGGYWDGLASTDYYNFTAQVSAPPNPQIAAGPDDVVTIVNRTIARYPNPNAAGNSAVANPYNNPPTSKAFLDTWLGSNLATICPTAPRSNANCVLDNASIRYDQMQGRFVVLFTVTDVPSHISNFVVVVSRFATFGCSTTNNPPASGCPNTQDLFTPPIVPVVGGPNTGGTNIYWVMYVIPVNVVLPAIQTGPAAVPPNGTVSLFSNNTTKFCMTPIIGGNPLSPPAPAAGVFTVGPVVTGCSNYFPTGARLGLDNDNIILTAPVLDVSQLNNPTTLSPGCTSTATVGCGPALPGGPYAGTRVVTVPKLVVYNGIALGGDPTNINGTGTGLVNLSDDTATGTLTVTTANLPACQPATPGFAGTCAAAGLGFNPIPPIFWEPDNLRGRSLASFNSQIGPYGTAVAGVITPIDYLVGRLVTDSFGGFTGFASTLIYVQPIVFSCPSGSIFNAPAGVSYCGVNSGPLNPGGGQIAETALLGTLISSNVQVPRSAFGIATTIDPGLVGQGQSDANTNRAVNGDFVNRLFVGDDRPQQAIFREGLLYIAGAARIFDNLATAALGTSTVIYDVLKVTGPNCGILQAAGQPNTCFASFGTNPYTPNGSRLANPALVLETEWFNGQQTPDPTGNIFGYGFYAPMYDVPANVVNGSALPTSSGISPINLFPWLEKLFVGNTVGGPATINGTFATHFPSLWDFRPGDDAYDTNLPYLDPVTGTIVTSVPCSSPLTGFATVTTGSRTISNIVINGVPTPTAVVGVGWTININPSAGTQPNATVGGTPLGSSLPAAGVTFTFPAAGGLINAVNSGTSVTYSSATAAPTVTPSAASPILNVSVSFTPPANCPMIPFGIRGGASTDPNDGSLWLYGAFGKPRMTAIIGPGQWGTSVANYQLDFPGTDPYGNDNAYFADVPTSNIFFNWIQIAKNIGIAAPNGTGTCPTSGFTNPPIIPPPVGTNSGGTTTGAAQVCNTFGPDAQVTRAEMARWVILGQMDEAQVILYLQSTGGLPVASGLAATSFGDLGSLPTVPGATGQQVINYIEAMYRRGYTKGCGSTNDGRRAYCPNDIITRGQMAVFLIRAKMSNVFPTSLSGVPLALNAGNSQGSLGGTTAYGDAFGLFTPAQSYFTDNPTSDPFYIYIQKMRELRITNGTGASAYSPGTPLSRKEIATFIVRAFFL